MRKSNQQTIGEVIGQFLKQHGLDKKLLQSLIVRDMEEIFGAMFAKHIKRIYFQEKKLFLEIESSSLRHELSMQKTVIIEKVNKVAGEQLITDIVLK